MTHSSIRTQTTRHARKRMQQRGIDDLMVELIEIFGQHNYQAGGCEHCFVPRDIIAQLRSAVDRLPNTAVIMDGPGQVITAMHQHRRIRHKRNS